MVSQSAKEAAETEEKINMTPMIDVTFLLLIFFLVTIKFKSLDAKIVVDMPTSFGSQNTGEVEKPKIAIDIDVVEPGKSRFREGTGRAAKERKDWMHPLHFVQPVKILRYMRGTRLAERDAEVLKSGSPLNTKPPKIERPSGPGWDFDKWGKEYKDDVFTGRSPDGVLIPYNASKRNPVRILRYKIREQEPGNADRPIAVCYSIEELHYLMSQLFWKYFRMEIRLGLRDSNGIPPDPATAPVRFDEYKRKSPALVIKAGESVVLAWSIAKPTTSTPLRTDKRRVLVYKPKFVSYWLAEFTFKKDLNPIAQQLWNEPRQVAPYYDSMGWNVQYEDITEVLDMLHDNVFAERSVEDNNPTWPGGNGWRRDTKRSFAQVFIEQTFVGDSSVGFLPEKFTNTNLYILDYEPSTKLRRPN